MTSQPESSTAPGSARLRWAKLALAWALGFALLAWLMSRTPWAPLVDAVQRPGPLVWVGTLCGLLLSYGLRGARLQVVLDLDHGSRAAPRRWLGLRTDALRVILLHNAAVNLLPMRAGELSFPWLASRELKLPVSRAVVCLMWMRLQDLAVLAGLGLLLWPGLPLAWRALGLLGLVLAWHGGWWLLRRLVAASASEPTANATAAKGWRGIAAKLQSALLEPAHHRPIAWVLTAANWGLKLAAGATLLSAISETSWGVSWGGALGGELAAIFPLQGPAGFGTYEAGVWAGMAALLPHEAPALAHAVGAALALHVCFLVCAVCAAGLAAALSGGVSAQHAQEGLPPRHPG